MRIVCRKRSGAASRLIWALPNSRSMRRASVLWTCAGLDELRAELRALALRAPERERETVARLPIDRAFTMRGFGAVVTGTLVAGEIGVGEELELLPAGARVRVRGLQAHGRAIER